MKKKLKVSEVRERSNMVAAQLEGISVRLTQLSANAPDVVLREEMVVETKLSVRGNYDEEGVYSSSHYDVIAKTVPDESTVWQIQAEFVSTWKKRPNAVKLDFVDAHCFALSIGALVLHPYARECIQSTITRMGYPAFSLDLLASPLLTNDENEYLEIELPDDHEISEAD
jgi:preprotein translocase subunit SecB